MEPLFAFLIFAITGSTAYLVSSERRRAHLRVWRSAVRQAALSEVEETKGSLFEGGETVSGRFGDLRVRLEGYRHGKYERGTKIVVTGLGHGTGGLSLRREGFATAIGKSLIGEREIEIGDRAFDDEYYVQGPAPLALAILGSETRGRVAGMLRGRVAIPGRGPVEVHSSLTDGRLEVRVKETGFTMNSERVPEILLGVLAVARLLVAPRDVAARIAANLRAEPQADARLKGVLTLSREFPKHPATRETLLAARQDSSEEVRLRAAMALGEEGRETLVDLVARAGTGDSCAARAIDALGDLLPGGLAESTLRRALGGAGRPRTAQACLEALARLGRAEAEGLILDALRSEDAEVSVAAARALGRVGTVGAVPALSDAMPPRGDLPPSVGRQAIAEIQSRLAGAGPGQLSLAGGQAGALSLADGEPGRLALAEEPAERLPPPDAVAMGVRA